MPLKIPSRGDVVSAMQAYVRSNVPDLDPSTSRRSFIGGLVKSLASALHDWYVALKRYGDNEPFPQTATKDFLFNGWWRDITHLSPNPAAAASGTVVITGTSGATLDAGTELTANASTYRLVSTVEVRDQTLAVALTRDGSTAIAETASPHGLATGLSVTISGATEGDYNGTVEITVTADNEFTFDLGDLVPASPATGSPRMTATWANGVVTATVKGQSGNIDAGGFLAISDPPADIDVEATVTFGGIAGGSEAEGVEPYRERILKALGTDFGAFTGDEIEIVAKRVPGVTRVWVRRATRNGTNGVLEGQVKVAFLRDNDANPFPSSQEVATVKASILANCMTANTAEEDVMVSSPTERQVHFEFQALIPDTPSMRRAIRASLKQFFQESVDYATPIVEDDYRCAIKDAYDREAKQKLRSFTLAYPTGDIAISAEELPTLGTVRFP